MQEKKSQFLNKIMAYFLGHGQQVKNPCPILHITVTVKVACTSVKKSPSKYKAVTMY